MATNGKADDAAILELIARGARREAAGALIDAYGDAVFSFCLRMIRDRELASDVRQKVFLEACRDLERFNGRSSLRTWLFGIASHRCLDEGRRRVRASRHESFDELGTSAAEPMPTAWPNPIDLASHSELARALEDCLGKLPDDVRATVLLRHGSELSYEEMAERLGVKANTLQARVARAEPALRECLEAKGIEL
jgi:RNA polymerase sigma-70 factor (ECF subfamily)